MNELALRALSRFCLFIYLFIIIIISIIIIIIIFTRTFFFSLFRTRATDWTEKERQLVV